MSIGIYDFDGVLCDPIEDTVFRLPDNELDAAFIKAGRDRYGITKLSNHDRRNRHLILQEVLYERRMPCRPGPLIKSRFARTTLVNEHDVFYVLTARSGPGAVARVSSTLEQWKLRPEEMFFVGPVSKTSFLTGLSQQHPDCDLVFYDDTMYHIEEAEKLGLPNLKSVWVDNQVDSLKQKALTFYKEQFTWLLTTQVQTSSPVLVAS